MFLQSDLFVSRSFSNIDRSAETTYIPRYVKITACFPARFGMKGDPPKHWLCLDEKMIE